jgi:hypothetical protein
LGKGKILSMLEIGGRVRAMKLSLPGQIVRQAEYSMNSLKRTDCQRTENIAVDLGIFGEPI